MAKFLSDEWFQKVTELTQAAGDLDTPAAIANLKLNVTVTGTDDGDVQFAMAGGLPQKGHVEGAQTTLTVPYDVAHKVFVKQDQSAGMQAFMSGQIKVEGDMGALMSLQSAQPGEKATALLKEINDLTAA